MKNKQLLHWLFLIVLIGLGFHMIKYNMQIARAGRLPLRNPPQNLYWPMKEILAFNQEENRDAVTRLSDCIVWIAVTMAYRGYKDNHIVPAWSVYALEDSAKLYKEVSNFQRQRWVNAYTDVLRGYFDGNSYYPPQEIQDHWAKMRDLVKKKEYEEAFELLRNHKNYIEIDLEIIAEGFIKDGKRDLSEQQEKIIREIVLSREGVVREFEKTYAGKVGE
ncbi:MAG: hypothetical protein HQL23_00100 [Candidatus Omnitrophica bacterium]|nr:hypothetical protein [Candidatus Omnitrophota bacterium]